LKLKHSGEILPLVVGGYRTKQASILERRHEMISIGATWVDDEESIKTLHDMIGMAMSFRDCLNKKAYSFGKSLGRRKSPDQGSNIAASISNKACCAFFQDSESLMYKYIASEQEPNLSEEIAKELGKISLNIFEEVTLPYLSDGKALKSYSLNKVGLQKELNKIIKKQKPKELSVQEEGGTIIDGSC
jgi:CRISPR system Cascade subunit CasA